MITPDARHPSGPQPRGTIESGLDRFVWSPPLTDSATRARRRIRIVSAALVLSAALWAAASVWSDGLDAVVFALIVPLLLVMIAVGIDRLFAVGSGLRVEVDDQTLTLVRGARRDRVGVDDLATVSVVSKSTGWYVVIGRVDGDPLSALVPVGVGSAFDRLEATALEAELRRRLQR